MGLASKAVKRGSEIIIQCLKHTVVNEKTALFLN
jgi:hypothetical protein